MIMHIWMHWFWITTSYFKGFLFFTAQTISFSCISYPLIAEAGLLDNQTLAPITPEYYKGNDSSQLGDDPNVSSPTVIEEGNLSQETTPSLEKDPEETTISRNETQQTSTLSSPSDAEDTHNGGSVDVFQYPLKKFVKYSHLKYGKVVTKGKQNEQTVDEERKLESVKVVEENVSINISETTNGTEVDKSNDSSSEGSTPELSMTAAPDLITTTTTENVTGGEERKEEQDAVPTSTDGVLPPPDEDPNEVQIIKNETLMIENKVEEPGTYTTVEPSAVKNRVAASTSAQNYEVEQSDLNVGSITGITLGILVIFSLFGAVSFVLYRRRYLNKPQVLHDKCSNLDSSGYIDETSLRENSEEMYSLDNDSFLNSLEAMTIQNYWTENVKHTKL